MLGVIMLFSFLFPLAGTLAIRRYRWIAAWAVMAAMICAAILYKVSAGLHDPMGWGIVFVLVFMPAAIGSALGAAITAFRRWRMGPGELTALNMGLAASWSLITLGFTVVFLIDL